MNRNGGFMLTEFLKGVVILETEHPPRWDLMEREISAKSF